MENKQIDNDYLVEEYENNIKLVFYVTRNLLHLDRNWYYNYYSFEDVCSVVRIGLLRGIKSYKSDKGISKSTYYCSCIKHEIISVCIRCEGFDTRKINKNTISFNKIVHVSSELPEDELINVYYDHYDYEINLKLQYYKSVLLDLINEGHFTEIELFTLNKLFNGYTYQEIANERNVSKQRIGQVVNKIKNKLKKIKL